MADEIDSNLYAWEEDPANPIFLFSTHEFLDQLQPPTLSIERIVANAAAAFLASNRYGSA